MPGKSVTKPRQKRSQLESNQIPDDWTPFPIRTIDIPYTTGKKHKTWCYHMPNPWKVEESRRRIMNMLGIPDDLKQFMILVNTFYLKNEHAYVGKRNIGTGFLKLLQEKHAVIEQKKLEVYAIVHAQNLFSNEMITAEEFGSVFESLTESLAKRQKPNR